MEKTDSAKKLGSKHSCKDCACLFYDLGKPKPKCPKCGSESFLDVMEGQIFGGANEPAKKKRGSKKKRKEKEDFEPIHVNDDLGLLDDDKEEVEEE